MSHLTKDKRPITAVYFPTEAHPGYTVGLYGVTEINAYDDHGPGGYMPWIAVCNEKETIVRIPAWQVSVHYQTQEDLDNQQF